MQKVIFTGALAAALGLPLASSAAGQDEMWEVTTQMNMPGMPAGMGAHTSKVCQDKDLSKQTVQGQNENCKVTDTKQSGNRVTTTVKCPDSTMVIDNTYNAARTEFKGTMKSTGGKGDMTVAMSGRKVGTCDAQQARQERSAQQAKVQDTLDKVAADTKRRNDEQIKQCAVAVDTMDMSKLGIYAQCKQSPELCKSMASAPGGKEVADSCTTKQTEYCKRYQTEAGFIKAKADRNAAQMCGVSVDAVKASLCPGAAQRESLDFLGRYCPVEAKPVAQQHCAGRDFTALRASRGAGGDKYSAFCYAYLSNSQLETADTESAPNRAAARRAKAGDAATAKPADTAAAKPAVAPKSNPANPADAVSEGVSQGINKLRGLFGR
jgi:hypothetical protein